MSPNGRWSITALFRETVHIFRRSQGSSRSAQLDGIAYNDATVNGIVDAKVEISRDNFVRVRYAEISMLHHLQFFIDENVQAVLVRPKLNKWEHLMCCKDDTSVAAQVLKVFCKIPSD
jgi:hypothetical protein